MKEIKYVTGDATFPEGEGPKIIAHICNDAGAWGSGFVLAISKRWEEPEERYRSWAAGKLEQPFELGQAQFVDTPWSKNNGQTIWVANMIAQHGLTAAAGVPPIRYEALNTALEAVAKFALATDDSVHMPRIGCGLAGGTWERVGPIVERCLTQRNISVTVYDLP